MEWHDVIFPEKTDFGGNCSACCFRNAKGLCKKMTCSSDDTYIYWFSTKPGLSDGYGIPKLIDFFNQSQDIIKSECLKKIQNLK